MPKYLLPIAGDCYHITEDGKHPIRGVKVEIWAVTDKQPNDYRSCIRCARKKYKRMKNLTHRM